jgi:prepilin-type N-terminal cleavage/methylation domain-containing protein
MRTPPPSRHAGPPTRAAFSLIEVIGVLAIMAILAAIVTPNVVRQMALANGTREDRSLEVMADGLKRYVRNQGQIPGGTQWTTNLSSVLGMNVTEVQRVDPKNASNLRVYLIHPGFTPTDGVDPIFTQAAAGATAPTNARVMILSSTQPSLALPVSSGKAASAATFDAIWNWDYDPGTKAPPSGWPAAWNGNAEHLHVQRINLGALFGHATFSNAQFPTNIPFAKFNTLSTFAFSTTNAVDGYYLMGTVVRLYKHDTPYAGPPANPDQLDLTHTVEGDVNFLYDNAQWKMP